MKIERIIWVLIGIIVLVVIAGIIPGSPLYLPSFLGGGERSHEGHGVDYWVRGMTNVDPAERRKAIHALGAIGPLAESAVPAVAKLLESEHPGDRIEAAMTLFKMAPASRSTAAALGKALEDKEFFVRMNSAMALAKLGADAKPAQPNLVKAIKDKANQTNLDTFAFTIQEQAALALARATAGTSEGVPILIEALQEIREAGRNIKIETVNVGESAARMTSTPKFAGKDTRNVTVWFIRAKMVFARALAEVGKEAQPAVALLRTMSEEDKISDFHQEALEAIKKIETAVAASK